MNLKDVTGSPETFLNTVLLDTVLYQKALVQHAYSVC
jgi:hypothetical protein